MIALGAMLLLWSIQSWKNRIIMARGEAAAVFLWAMIAYMAVLCGIAFANWRVEAAWIEGAMLLLVGALFLMTRTRASGLYLMSYGRFDEGRMAALRECVAEAQPSAETAIAGMSFYAVIRMKKLQDGKAGQLRHVEIADAIVRRARTSALGSGLDRANAAVSAVSGLVLMALGLSLLLG